LTATGGNTGGFATGGTTGGTTGGSATGGSTTGGSTNGGSATGGKGGGGSAQGGSAGARNTGGNAGSSSGGSAGSVATTGGSGGGSSTAATPSAGCGKSGRPSNGLVTVSGQKIYTFPTTYDGTKPFPLFIGFHAAGNPIDQIQKLTNGSDLEKNYVRAFAKSAGNEWVYNTDLAKVTGMYDELVSTYCIDTSHVFAAGHSSGAQTIVQILTHKDAAQHMNFKAVAPVSASNYGAIQMPIAVMYIQGKKDNVRNSDGADVVARFTAVNKCTTTTTPYSSVQGCMSTDGSHPTVTPGCVSYGGCTLPTIWCSHDDPSYSGTSHGWPCFASKAMGDFFAGLP
jgi:hypothetical protein